MLISDNELLGKYLYKSDASALEELIRRHSGLVMGVCRNRLSQAHDADDAFQATFLILSRKAESLIKHDSIAGWLYQVAMRNCLQVQRHKRRNRETDMLEEPLGHDEPWQVIAQAQENELLNQEIDRLPRRYRDVIVLFHLQGHSRSETAELLRTTEASVKAALVRARGLLRRRLVRRGMVTSVALLLLREATVTAQDTVHPSLITATLEHCQGQTPTVSVGSTPESVSLLAQQGILSMHTFNVLKSISIAAGIMLAVAVPLAVIAQQTTIAKGTTSAIVSALDGNASGESGRGVTTTVTKAGNQEKVEVGGKGPSSGTVVLNQAIRGTEIFEIKHKSSDKTKNNWNPNDPNQFKIENSIDYWQALAESYELRIKGLTKGGGWGSASGNALLRADIKEFEAKLIEAVLNIKRIEFEKSNAFATASVTRDGEIVRVDSSLRPKPQTVINRATDATAIAMTTPPKNGTVIPPGSKHPVSPGEALLIESFSDASLNRRVVVQADATISLPLVGTVEVLGKTPQDVSEILEVKFSQFVKSPQIFVAREIASQPMGSKKP